MSDLSSDFLSKVKTRDSDSDIAAADEFQRGYNSGTMTPTPVGQVDSTVIPAPRPLPKQPPLRAMTSDPLGRLMVQPSEQESAGKAVSRNVAEVPGQAIKGVEDAIHNAVGWAIDPLADWLNENVADLSIKREKAKTPLGDLTHSVSEFLTGFIPALKGMRAVGLTGKVAAPLAAGAIAQFAAQDPASGRLADIWKKLNLPENLLTNYLSSKPEDTEMEMRFKNALEGAGLGVATEGVFLAARTIKAARSVKGAKKLETQYLREKYGELTDGDFNAIVGDPSKPSVELVVHKPPETGAKLTKAAENTKNIDPRSILKAPKTAQPVTEDDVYKSLPTVNRGVMYDGKLYEASGNETHIDAVKRALDDVGKANFDVSKMETGIVTPEGKFLTHAQHQSGEFGVFKDNTGGVPKALLEDETARRNAVAAAQAESSVYINFAKFDEPDEVKNAIGKMADLNKGSIDEATRGTITQKETQKLADDLGLTVTDLLQRKQGEPFNAETAVAARQIWAASGEKLIELAKVAAGPNAGPLDQFAFRKQMAVHAAIQSEIIGARTETARALASWKMDVKGGIERARAVDQIMSAMGGPEQSAEMARRLAILSELNANPAAIAKFVEQGKIATSVDAIKEAWINGLLSSPKTHVVNIMSNSLVMLNQIVERQLAGGLRAMSGGEGVEMIEAAAMTAGMVNSVREAWQMAAKALKTGETSWSFNKMDLPKTHAISPEAFNISSSTAMGKFIDFLGTGARVPTRLLGAEDEFFKTMGYRMELYAQAARTAASEGKTGYELGRRMAEIVQNPPEHIMINSADAALYQTFTNEVGSFGRWIMNGRTQVPALTFILPFVRTPVNIARYAFERSPLAPLVSQWRADVAAGGARADLALARMSSGTMLMLSVMDLADRGVVSGAGTRGGKDSSTYEALQRQGWQPYSVKVGDRWVSYNRTDPFGMTMGMAASIAEAVRHGEISQDEVDEWQEVAGMAVAAVSQVVINKTYLEGMSNFIELMSEPKRHSQKYIDDLFASFVPLTSLSNSVKNINDPVQREAQTPMEAAMARIAGLSEKLPPRRDLWGKEVTSESGLGRVYDAITPVGSRKVEDSPIDREMVRLNHGIERISKQTSFDGVQANLRFWPDVYDRYTKLAGNELKHPATGKGAKDYLDAVVSNKDATSVAYNMMPDETRKAFIQNTIQDYRKLAQQQILNDPKYANFAAEIAKLKEIHQNSRMPVMGGG